MVPRGPEWELRGRLRTRPLPEYALRFLPGDQETGSSVGTQSEVSVAEGGPGFLAVWADERTILGGTPDTVHLPLGGNLQDIYGQVLDPSGDPLGPPVLVANLGRNQRDPVAAWNGENWLVVFETDQPDWYFHQNVYGVRVSPVGEVLDPDPLVIFVEKDGQGAYDPAVTSDGQDWLVVADQWINSNRVVRARRIAPDGSFLDAKPVNLHKSSTLQNPVVEFAGGVYLLAANDYSNKKVYFRLFQTDLTPITPITELGPAIASQRTAVASKSDRFLVVGRDAHRIDPSGVVLDPAGIDLGGSEFSSFHEAAWTGTHWVVSMRTFGDVEFYDVEAQRISDKGTLLDKDPVLIELAASGVDNFKAPTAVGGSGNGDAVVVFVQEDHPERGADVRAGLLKADGTTSAAGDVSVGLRRQSYVRTATGNGEHLAVFVSERSDLTRILAQRLAPEGTPIDADPTVVHEIPGAGPTPRFQPEVAWNGDVYLVVWSEDGNVLGKRLSPSNTVLDPAPLTLVDEQHDYAAGAVAVAEDVFVVGTFHYVPFSENPNRYVEFVRVRGSDGAVLDADPNLVAGGFSREMATVSVGRRALLVWAQYALHDSVTAYVQGALVSADGSDIGPFAISSSTAKEPDAASEGNRALVTWHEGKPTDVRGRFVRHDGSFDGTPFTIASAVNHQMFPAASFDGRWYVVAWTDYRTNEDIEQLRGNIRAARVDPLGAVLDPGGFAVTESLLPEDLPAVTAMRERAVILFSMLHGEEGVPEVQRLGYRVFGTNPVPPILR